MYLGSDASLEYLLVCMRAVQELGCVMTDGRVQEAALAEQLAAVGLTTGARLSDTDVGIIRCIRQGLSTRETAIELGVSGRTVESHLTRLYEKFGAKNRVELANLTRHI
ncbi:MAG: hypothetical protein GEU28_10010 [Dehalococcoidia bacterium]|nr:hypothetical protein [Dehalococcoidia bacterium]